MGGRGGGGLLGVGAGGGGRGLLFWGRGCVGGGGGGAAPPGGVGVRGGGGGRTQPGLRCVECGAGGGALRAARPPGPRRRGWEVGGRAGPGGCVSAGKRSVFGSWPARNPLARAPAAPCRLRPWRPGALPLRGGRAAHRCAALPGGGRTGSFADPGKAGAPAWTGQQGAMAGSRVAKALLARSGAAHAGSACRCFRCLRLPRCPPPPPSASRLAGAAALCITVPFLCAPLTHSLTHSKNRCRGRPGCVTE